MKFKKILAIMQLPPPVHGQSLMNQIIYNSKQINSNYKFKTVQLHFTNLENIRKPSIKKLIKMIFYGFCIFWNLFRFKPDLVYFTLSHSGLAFYRDIFYVGLIKLFRVPLVYHLHGKGINKNAKKLFHKYMYGFVFRNSTVILLSKVLKKDIINVMPKGTTLRYLPNGIKQQEGDFDQPQKDENVSTLLFLSNLSKQKGVLILIEAVKLLITKNVKFKLKLVGQIHESLPEKIFLKIINHHSINQYVEYLGPLYGKDKDSILNSSDIFIFPSFNEAFPLVLLEAMQASLPIISTREGAIPEIVDDGLTGFLVERQNPRDLADKIEFLLNNEFLRKKMGKQAKAKFLRNYTKELFENNLDIIFKSLLYQQ